MKFRYIKRILPAFLLVLSLTLTTIGVKASQTDIDNANNQIDNLQNQIDDAQDELDNYNKQEDALKDDLKDLNSNLQSLANDMNNIESQISTKQEDIKSLSLELETATERAEQQYEDMKARIQFMYERGHTSLLVTLLESRSISDFLNRAEYVSLITSYDREMLNTYQQLQEEIATKKTALVAENNSLVALKDDMKEKQSNVSSLITKTEKDIDKTQSNIANANKDLEDLEEKLAYWEAIEKKLEEEKAIADQKKWEELQQLGKEDFSNIDYTPAEGEAYLLAAIIQCEAEGEPYEGKIAVGNVVMNRVKSTRFPNTITGVIYQKNQFSPASSGRLADRLERGVNDECIRAATEVLQGKHIIDALFFRVNKGTRPGTVIGNHVFY